MSARDIIADEIAISRGRRPDECVHGNGWVSTDGSGFECSLTARQQAYPVANAVLQSLTAAGYRILAPGQYDPVTAARALDAISPAEFDSDTVVRVREAIRRALKAGIAEGGGK
ncbi:MAG TPA: hypothetical protein VF226_02855 [Hyphomicrobiaceae bacterium]